MFKKNKVSRLLSCVNSYPIMYPTSLADNYLEELETSDFTTKQEVEKEKKYLNRLFKNNKPITQIKCI